MENIVLENACFRLEIAENAIVKSLIHKESGQECLQAGVDAPLLSATQERLYNNELKLAYPTQQTTFPATAIRMEGDALIVSFALVPYEAVVAVNIQPAYIGFALKEFRVKEDGYKGLTMDTPPVASLRLLQLPLALREKLGNWLNVYFDDRVAVNVLGTSPQAFVGNTSLQDGLLMYADLQREIGMEGFGAALIVTEPDKLLDAIDAVERDYNLPLGAKSRKDPLLNASVYWVGKADIHTIDTHIAYAKQGGFRLMLMHYGVFVQERNSWSLIGNYDFNESYPNGIEDVRAVVEKVKAAGLIPGLHFLHTHIGLESRYCVPVADHRLRLKQRYTLSRPLSETDTTVWVEENPSLAPMADGCRLLRFGGEIIQYTGVTTARPYCFTGCTRSKNQHKAAHERGLSGGVLDVSEFCATSVYLDQDTDLQDEIAQKLAKLYNTGFQFVYMDGSEGTNPPFGYHIPNAQYRVFQKFATPPLFCEGAAKAHFSWHMLSGGNAFDIFKTEEFKEKLVEHPFSQVPRTARDFTRVNFGWWQYYPDTEPDIYEFGTSRAAAWDCPVTVKGYPERFGGNARTADNLEVMRRWEDVRRRNWLTPAQKEMLRDPSVEHTLLINEAGEYELVPYYPIETDPQIRAFRFTRKGENWVVYWHRTGEGKLRLPLRQTEVECFEALNAPSIAIDALDGGCVVPVSGRRYIKGEQPLEEAFRKAELLAEEN